VAPPPAPAVPPAAAVPLPSPRPTSPTLALGRDNPFEKPKEEKRPGRTKTGKSRGGDDVFESVKPTSSGKKPTAKSVGDDDIFETQGKSGSSAAADCIATISSKPWAEVSIDGKPTGKITPLVNYSIPCGKHRLTFKNADLMIERNESVTLKSGQPFKKIFSLVENEL
jgi:hypothetical protein